MLYRISRWVVAFLLTLLLLVALAVAFARQFLPSVAEYRESAEQFLSERAGFPISIQSITAQWEERYPTFRISGIQGDSRGAEKALDTQFSIGQLDVEMDIISSLLRQAPIFSSFSIQKLNIELFEQNGQWTHFPTQTSPRSSDQFLEQIIALLSLQPSVSFEQAKLTLHSETGRKHLLEPLSFKLENTRSQHHINGRLSMLLSSGSRTSVEFALESGALSSDILNTEFMAYARVSNLGESLLNINAVQLPFVLKKLDIGGEVWAHIEDQKISRLQGRISLPELEMEGISNRFSQGRFDFSLQPLEHDKYRLALWDLSVAIDEHPITLPYNALDLDLQNRQLLLQALSLKQINLSQLTEAFTDQRYLPEELSVALQKLAPEGYIENLSVKWPVLGEWSNFNAEADLNNVGVGDYFGAPSLRQVSGRLRLTPSTGVIDLDTNNFSMGFPDLFKEAWTYTSASGRIYWVIDESNAESLPIVTVRSDLINLSNPSLSAAGRFSMYLPLDRNEQTELTLLIGMKNADGKQASSYIPAPEVGEGLYNWIDSAIQGGTVNDGMLVLLAGTRHLEERSAPTVQLYFDVDNAKVKFQPNWPEVEDTHLNISIDRGAVAIKAEGGKLLNSHIGRVNVGLAPNSDKLFVATDLTGDAGDIMTLLQGPALSDQVGKGLQGWALSGRHTTKVELEIGLNQNISPNINVISQLADGVFSSERQRIRFGELNGGVTYSSSKGLFSDELKTQFLDQPAAVNIETLPKTASMPSITRVNMRTYAEMKSLQKWSELSLLKLAKGKARVEGRMDLCGNSPLCNKLIVESDLKGVALDLPEPFNKTAAEVLDLQLVAQLGSDAPVWRYNLGDQLRGVSRLDPQGGKHHISFGGSRPEEVSDIGVWIDGELARVNFAQVERFIDQAGWRQEGVVSSDSGLKQLSLNVGQFELGDMTLEELALVVSRAQNTTYGTRVGLVSEQVTGEIRIPSKDADPYIVNLKHLYLDSGDDEDKELSTKVIETQGWPVIHLDIASLYLDQKPLGHWQMVLQPEENNGLSVNNLFAQMDGFTLQGSAGWEVKNQRSVSFLDSKLTGGDFGKLLARIGYKGVVESTSTAMENKFVWLGYPWEFKSKHLDGIFKMEINKGRIVEAGNSSNILRIFGILNLNTIIRRLQLNFSDLLEKGVAFDTLKANYLLSNGIANAQEPLVLQGPSANINMTGSINIPAKSLDSQMDVVLPLTSNLPIAAVLLGAPQVAGAVFIIDKLIGDKLQKVSTLKYRLTGPWAEPEIDVFSEKKDGQATSAFVNDK